MNVRERVSQTIEEHALISAGDTVLLGLSGGPDSLCLLHVLASLREKKDFVLRALHLNHLMRGEAAEADVRFLQGVCAGLDVSLSVAVCDVRARAVREGISEEEAGRAARHEALQEEAAGLEKKGAFVHIAFAHNRNDQAETVLMRILRGTGVHGLAAMEYLRADGVIRPLLDVPRPEIEAFCEAEGLSPRRDSTNDSEAYTRNRLRRSLIPMLEEEYNPNLLEGLIRLSESAREDDACLGILAGEKLAQLMLRQDEAGLHMDCRALRTLPAALFKRAVILAFQRIGLKKDIASVHLDALNAAVREGRFGKIIQFPQGYYARVLAREVLLGWSNAAFIKEKKL